MTYSTSPQDRCRRLFGLGTGLLSASPLTFPCLSSPRRPDDRIGDRRLSGHGRHSRVGLACRYASAAIRRFRAEAQRRLGSRRLKPRGRRRPQPQLSREQASWTAGCAQSRADVVTLMRLILA